MSLASRSRTELIDQALDGQSAEVKARVLAIIIRYDIDVRNEFFLVFVAIGHLLAIVEEAPENWRALFDEFERKLDEWSEQNLRTLAAVQKQGQEAERMSRSFLKLTDSLKLSNDRTLSLQETLKGLSKDLSRLTSSLGEIRGESRSVASRTEALSQRFSKTESELKDMASRVDWTWSINWGLTTSILLLSMMFGWTLWRQQSIIAEQNQRLGWLLMKANREECWNGIKPADDPLCQQLLE